jgi:hypothetical protein
MDTLLVGKYDPPWFKQDQISLLSSVALRMKDRLETVPTLNIHSDRDRNPIHFARNDYSHPPGTVIHIVAIIIHFDRNPHDHVCPKFPRQDAVRELQSGS